VLPSGGVRILLDYRSALRNRTGVGEFTHSMAAALARTGGAADQVVLFSSSWKDRLAPGSVPGASVIDRRIPVSVLNFAWHRLEWPQVEHLAAGGADVAWSLHPMIMPARSAARVITIYDLYFLDHPEGTSREVRRDYAALAADHARRADAIIVCSEYTRDRVVARFGVAAEKISVCYPGAPGWTPREQPSTPGPILHVGTWEPRKNIPALQKAYLDLARDRPDTPQLVLVGGGGSFASLHSAADTELLRTRMRTTGYLSDEEKLRFYREASMLVMASTDEGFGIPALEAMTIGLPIVASNRGALPEVIGDAGLLVDPEDSVAFSAAIRRVLDDGAFSRDLARRGVERSRRFNWDTSATIARSAFHAAVVRGRGRS
jgi:glycosyltransferase involved in cell wall biosynthesis